MTRERVVHIVDDEDMMRRSLERVLLSEGYEVFGYATAAQFLNKASSGVDGCILIDVVLPLVNGLQLQAHLTKQGVTLPVIVMTGRGDVPTAVAAMKAGAVDFLTKPIDTTLLIAAIERAFAKSFRSQEQTGAVLRIARLTPRERLVLDGLVGGSTNKLIAHDLGLSVRTVELHRMHMMRRLGARTIAEAIRFAVIADHDQ
jgi:two-component system response regulator FixJ